jgi:hypothetical protein
MKNSKKVERSSCKKSTDEENLSIVAIVLPLGLFIAFMVFLIMAMMF